MLFENYGVNPPQFWSVMWGIVRAHQLQAMIAGGLWLAGRVAAGLLGDRLLRGKIIGNIEKIKREDAVLGLDDSVRSSAGEGAMQRLNRHQLLARMGGVSFFAPMLCFWALQFLPGMLLNFIGLFVR
jgi:hypothetical protein